MQILKIIINCICKLLKKCPEEDECMQGEKPLEEFTEKVCHIIEELQDLP